MNMKPVSKRVLAVQILSFFLIVFLMVLCATAILLPFVVQMMK